MKISVGDCVKRTLRNYKLELIYIRRNIILIIYEVYI